MGGRKSQASKLNANSLRRTIVVVISLLVALSQIFFIQHPFMLLEHHQVQNDQVAAEHQLDPPTYSGDDRSYVALCLSVKDEPDIREWIWHHYSTGVKYFYIFDTGSAIPLRPHIQDFIDAV